MYGKFITSMINFIRIHNSTTKAFLLKQIVKMNSRTVLLGEILKSPSKATLKYRYKKHKYLFRFTKRKVNCIKSNISYLYYLNKNIMENNQEPIEQSSSIEEPLEQLSISDAITGVITSPGETFDTIVKTKKKNYWIIPILLSIVIGVVVTFVFFRDAQLMSGIMDKQKSQLEKRMEEQVKSGKMSPEQSKQAIEQAEKFMDPKSLFFQIIGYGGVAIVPFLMLFVLSLVYLLLLKIFKADVDFGNLLNVVGLPMIITIIGSIISLVLSILMGTVSTLSPALILNEGMVGSKMAEFLTKVDLISIWYYIAFLLGFQRLQKSLPGNLTELFLESGFSG